jgi:hypothetical protein
MMNTDNRVFSVTRAPKSILSWRSTNRKMIWNFWLKRERDDLDGKKRFLGHSIRCMSDVNFVRKRAGTVFSDGINK